MKLWTRKDIQFLRDNSHLTYKTLGKELGVSKEAVRHQFRTLKIPKVKASAKKYEIDEAFFSNWSSEMAYVLGFTFADGNIRRRKTGSVKLRICNSDKNVLLQIRKLLKSNHPIYVDKRTYTDFELNVPRSKIVKDIHKLGMTENNSRTMEFPYVPDKYFFSFVRGYFDGDGHVEVTGKTGRKIRISFASGSKSFLHTLKSKLENRGIQCSMRTLREGYENESYQVSVLKKGRKIFYKGLYGDDPINFNAIKMESKYQLLINYFEKNIKIQCLDCGIIMEKRAHNHLRCTECSHEREKQQKREKRKIAQEKYKI
ncbi:MAG: hypothetical protein GPJ54_16780 [Candidatus Heimdallarchaeota archaeon]|nr:hypothetical protein [Candidatus Heimdallarchaeota archaeon]